MENRKTKGRRKCWSAIFFALLVALALPVAAALAADEGGQETAQSTGTAAVQEPSGAGSEPEAVRPLQEEPARAVPREVAAERGSDTTLEVAGAKIKLSGYLREYLSMNLQNPPETKADDRWNLSMARSTIWLDADVTAGDVRLHAVGRASGEIKTDYLKRLEALGAANGNLMAEYNKSELREAFAEFSLGPRTLVRLGKQQVVWGETDFFHAMDIVSGFDFTWRSFLEAENEEYRKGLILANAIVQVPELSGSLQLLFRPGLDQGSEIGNTYDLFGGRWANQPNKGVNFLNVLPYNFRHEKGDIKDPTWGVRWSGILGPMNYSLAYLRTFGPDPFINSVFAPIDGIPTTGSLGELIFPKVDMFGLTASGYSALADAVFSTEWVYMKGVYYNTGHDFLGGALPGFAGFVKKDTVRAMVRMDKNVNLSKIIFTSRPSLFSVQFFDTWIPNWNQKDDIVDLAGYGAPKKEHSTIGTVILGMNYMSDRINPTLAGGYDLSYGGGFVVPSVDFAFGDKWRLKVEADLFFPHHSKSPGEVETQTHIFGYFANNDQLFMRLTRQF